MPATDKSRNINRRIFALAIPAIFNNITVPLLGLSDTTIAGHLGSASFLAAMAVGSMMLNVIFWLSGFLRMGTTGLSAQAYGAGDLNLTLDILKKASIIAFAISAFVLIFQIPLQKLLFLVIAPEDAVSEFAAKYFFICIWGVPAQLVIMAISGWFIGLQNTFIPMVIAVGVNIVNILLSIFLVFGVDMGFAGIATGTLAANWLGAMVAVVFVKVEIRKQKSKFEIRRGESTSDTYGDRNVAAPGNVAAPDRAVPDGAVSEAYLKWSRFFSVNTDLFFRSACIMGVTLAMTSYGSRLGETTLAANAVIMQFFLFFSYFMDGFAFAGEAITGSALGAKQYALLRKSVNILLIWGVVMASLFLLIYLFWSSPITSLLTTSGEVRKTVDDMHLWLVIMPPVTVAAFIFDGIFIGLARTRPLLFTTLIATVAYFAIASGGQSMGLFSLSNTTLWMAFGVYLLLRGILLGLDYVKIQRKMLIL